MQTPDIPAAHARVMAEIAAAAAGCGRSADEITLIAVSKTQPAARIAALIACGQRDFGENRVQEAAGKWPALRASPAPMRLHLIGPLQTNKAREAVALFDAIHSLDRPKLAAALAGECARQGRRPQLFVQVNVGREPQKAGVAPEEAPKFLRLCADEFGLGVAGLMCIPPQGTDPAPHFAALRRLAEAAGLGLLSMGMSGDFATAIAQGATHVRVGTALFGARH